MAGLEARCCAATLILIVGGASYPTPTAADQTPQDNASSPQIDYPTVRLDRRMPAAHASGPITLDGVFEESSWAAAPIASHFIQNDPREGQPATFDTEVRVLYDDAALYFGVFALDGEPARLIVNDIKKDFDTANSDGFKIVLDTFHDERNGYTFATNPAGAKWDAQMVGEGRETNANWDGIWDVATRVTETGWYAEIRIPFRTLKFPSTDMQSWGLNFERKVRRLNEDSYWAPVPRIYDLNRVSMAGTVEDLRGLRPGLNLRFKPYMSTSSSTLATRKTTGDFDGGLDVKYGVTTGLVWDFTVNTDFSQVEADEQQINLTRFSLFFPEKRDFFLENSGIFQFGGGGRDGGPAGGARQEMRLFFTRRIGLSDNGDSIPILAGTRLTGRQGDYSLGVLNIQQREHEAQPGVNFTALRLRRNVLANSDVGVVLLNKDAGGPRYNRIAGLDANFRFGYLAMNGFVTRSLTTESVLPRDGNAYATRAFIEYQSPRWQAQGGYGGLGERFVDEMGFIPRPGTHNLEGRVGPRYRPIALRKWVRQMQPHFEFEVYTRQSDGTLETAYQGYHHTFQFQDGSFTEFAINRQTEDVDTPFTVNSARGIQVQPGRYKFVEYVNSFNTLNSGRRVGFMSRVAFGPFYDGYLRSVRFGPAVKLNENFNAAVNVQINDGSVSTGSFVTKLLSTFVNYNFNTKIFFNALVQYNSDSHQWSSNLRFNLIHRPLSDFYLVYNDRRDERSGTMLSRAVIAKFTYLMVF